MKSPLCKPFGTMKDKYLISSFLYIVSIKQNCAFIQILEPPIAVTRYESPTSMVDEQGKQRVIKKQTDIHLLRTQTNNSLNGR